MVRETAYFSESIIIFTSNLGVRRFLDFRRYIKDFISANKRYYSTYPQ